ncbi:MFS transporter [Ornithinibacillus contaminans]|uniref:MFS transporter n=1 Tax=Ornithinibacillus contaminans TaxID=694055 RepID=UPI002E81F1A5|nr:MFS transporter [Ornithinibacillus contaminans]
MQKEKLWTKDFISVSVVNFVMMLSMYLLLVTMASYATEKYDASTSMAGLVSSIFIIGVLIGRLYIGKELGRFGSKKVLVIGIVFFVLVTMLYFIPANLYVLLIVRFLHGLGVGFATTATGTMIAQIIPTSRKGEGIGYFSLSVILSTAIGPLIGIILIEYLGYPSIFVFSLVVGIISLFIALPVNPPVINYEEVEERKQKGFRISNYLEPSALPVSIVMLVAAMAYSSTLSFITSYAADIDLVEAGSMYFFFYAIAVLSRPFTGKIMDVKGANLVAFPALVLFAIGMFILSQATSNVVFLIAAALIGLGYGNLQSIIQTLAIKVTPPHRMGLANSTYFIALDFGIGIGPFVLGFIIPEFGYRGMYSAMVGLIVISIVLYYFLHGRKEKKLFNQSSMNEN